MALSMLGRFMVFVIVSFLSCIFPTENGIFDASDIPISLIKNAIGKLETFEFSDSFAQRQAQKIQIIELMSFTLEYFIKADNGKKVRDFMNVFFALLAGQYSEAAQNDVLFRTNGLYKKMDELCAHINNMNSQEEQSRIVQDLKMYLRVIEDRDLSQIEPVKYEIKEADLTSFAINTVSTLKKIL